MSPRTKTIILKGLLILIGSATLCGINFIGYCFGGDHTGLGYGVLAGIIVLDGIGTLVWWELHSVQSRLDRE